MKALEEPSYKEQARTWLQELVLRNNFSPGHPQVVAAKFHLEFTTAAAVASVYFAPRTATFYQGCDLFYQVPCRPASPLSPAPIIKSGKEYTLS